MNKEMFMKEKEYEEYEVWVTDDFYENLKMEGWSYVELNRASKDSGEFDVKAKLLIPKPERKVTITEGEFSKLLKEEFGVYMSCAVTTKIEEIFGRE
jgi:hypothetical protein